MAWPGLVGACGGCSVRSLWRVGRGHGQPASRARAAAAVRRRGLASYPMPAGLPWQPPWTDKCEIDSMGTENTKKPLIYHSFSIQLVTLLPPPLQSLLPKCNVLNDATLNIASRHFQPAGAGATVAAGAATFGNIQITATNAGDVSGAIINSINAVGNSIKTLMTHLLSMLN
eukprot:g45164.t1